MVRACTSQIKLAEGEKRRPLSLGRDRNESRDLGGAGDWPPLRREKDRQLFSTVFPYIERRTCPYDWTIVTRNEEPFYAGWIERDSILKFRNRKRICLDKYIYIFFSFLANIEPSFLSLFLSAKRKREEMKQKRNNLSFDNVLYKPPHNYTRTAVCRKDASQIMLIYCKIILESNGR